MAIILVGILVVNLILFWLYYARTNRLLDKIAERQGVMSTRLMGRIEQRLAARVHERPRPQSGVAVWAIIVTYDRQAMLETTVRSLRRHEPAVRVLVVDNGSRDATQAFLAQARLEGLVDKVILNTHEDVPQWQKGFAIHQASALLSLEPMTHFLLLDDDIEIRGPFVERSLAILRDLAGEEVRLVSLLTDDEQNDAHPTLAVVDAGGVAVRLKESFNGAFVLMPLETLERMGLPPIREGADGLAAEDWFWSRQLQGHGWRVACVDAATHLGRGLSKRIETVEGKSPSRASDA